MHQIQVNNFSIRLIKKLKKIYVIVGQQRYTTSANAHSLCYR